jgi:hypothetical protein
MHNAGLRFVFFHPDYTVGFGITPNLLTFFTKALAGFFVF